MNPQIEQYQDLIRYEQYRIDEKKAGRVPEDFDGFLEWEAEHGKYVLPEDVALSMGQLTWNLTQMPVDILLGGRKQSVLLGQRTQNKYRNANRIIHNLKPGQSIDDQTLMLDASVKGEEADDFDAQNAETLERQIHNLCIGGEAEFCIFYATPEMKAFNIRYMVWRKR